MKSTKTVAGFLCAVLLFITAAIPVTANNQTASRPSCLAINAAEVETITVINRELHVSYAITAPSDRKAVVNTLNTLEYRPRTNASPDMDGLRLLSIRFKDGGQYQYWCHRNTLINDDKQLTDGLACADLYKLFDRFAKNYPANVEWLGYMNPYRITSLEIQGSNGTKTYRTNTSESQRKIILDICTRLKAYKPSKVRQLKPKETLKFSQDSGSLLYALTLDFETGREIYHINLYDNGEIGILVDSIPYALAYTSADQTLFQSLITALYLNA